MSAQADLGGEQARAAAALREAFPSMPPCLELDIAGHAFSTRGKECVWMDRRLPQWARADAMATAWVRHRETPYERLLPRKGDPTYHGNRLARSLVEQKVRAVLAQWRRPADG